MRKIPNFHLNLTDKTSKNAGGKSSSIEPMSLENLFKIRPRDEVSVLICQRTETTQFTNRIGVEESTGSPE